MDTIAMPVRRRRRRSPMPPMGITLPRKQRYRGYARALKRDAQLDEDMAYLRDVRSEAHGIFY